MNILRDLDIMRQERTEVIDTIAAGLVRTFEEAGETDEVAALRFLIANSVGRIVAHAYGVELGNRFKRQVQS